jgi:hypothetical protein
MTRPSLRTSWIVCSLVAIGSPAWAQAPVPPAQPAPGVYPNAPQMAPTAPGPTPMAPTVAPMAPTVAPMAPAAPPSVAPRAPKGGASDVDSLETASRDKAAGSELAWYIPTRQDPAPPPPPAPPNRWALGGLFDVHSFMSGGLVEGTASEIRFRAGGLYNAAVLGVIFPRNLFVVGYDGLRYNGVPVYRGETSSIHVLFPTLEPRLVLGSDVRVLAFGSALTGLRYARCPMFVDFRIPRFDTWVFLNFKDPPIPQWSWGASLAIGFEL